MKFEQVSFRTNEQERLLLERLNQRYKCKSITAFMHQFLQEIIDKQVFIDHEETPKAPNVFGDFGFDLDSAKGAPEPKKLATPDPMLAPQNENDLFYQ